MKSDLGFKKLGRCEICGTEVYESPANGNSWKKVEEGIVHMDCHRREEERKKENKNIRSAVF